MCCRCSRIFAQYSGTVRARRTSGKKKILFQGVAVGVLSRIGVALDSDLLERFDDFISRLGYTNGSEASRDMNA